MPVWDNQMLLRLFSRFEAEWYHVLLPSLQCDLELQHWKRILSALTKMTNRLMRVHPFTMACHHMNKLWLFKIEILNKMVEREQTGWFKMGWLDQTDREKYAFVHVSTMLVSQGWTPPSLSGPRCKTIVPSSFSEWENERTADLCFQNERLFIWYHYEQVSSLSPQQPREQSNRSTSWGG